MWKLQFFFRNIQKFKLFTEISSCSKRTSCISASPIYTVQENNIFEICLLGTWRIENLRTVIVFDDAQKPPFICQDWCKGDCHYFIQLEPLFKLLC